MLDRKLLLCILYIGFFNAPWKDDKFWNIEALDDM